MFSHPITRRTALGHGAAYLSALAAGPFLPGAVLCDGPLPIPPAAPRVFQWSVQAKDVSDHAITAFLWAPPEADHLRGVLIGGLTLMEQEFAVDPIIRRACAAERLAIVYFCPSLDGVFDIKEKHADQRLQTALDALAETSGHRELSVAPLFPYGHSVGTIFASHVVCWAPKRCFGALLFKGGMKVPVNDPSASLAGVPILVVKGQFEEFGPGPNGTLHDTDDREAAWKGMRDQILALRAADDHHLISYLVEPGATHYAWSDRVAEVAALFIRKAAQQRIPPAPADPTAPIPCRELVPSNGALTSSSIGLEAHAAPYGDSNEVPATAFWHLDLELAKAVDAFHAGMFDRKPQFVTFADPKTDKPIFVGHDHRLRMGANWTGPDTFTVAGTFLDQPPDRYPKVAGPVGHAEGPVRFRVFGGAILQVGPDVFRVDPGAGRPMRVNILAYHLGDAVYRPAEQHCRINLPDRLAQGRAQTITFKPIGPIRVGGAPILLEAKSSLDLPVRFYVESGPAVIEDITLKLMDVPRPTKAPLTITVVAYQYGSAIEPLVQSADPVRQMISVQR